MTDVCQLRSDVIRSAMPRRGGATEAYRDALRRAVEASSINTHVPTISWAEHAGRKTMEDVAVVTIEGEGARSLGVFAVLDGHAGREVANVVARVLPETTNSAFRDVDLAVASEVPSALGGAFAAVEAIVEGEVIEGGATATVLVGNSRAMWCANVGDSRAVMCRQGRAVRISVDHKASNEIEEERIKAAGGVVRFGRVDGSLAVSRAFGDVQLRPAVTERPTVCGPVRL